MKPLRMTAAPFDLSGDDTLEALLAAAVADGVLTSITMDAPTLDSLGETLTELVAEVQELNALGDDEITDEDEARLTELEKLIKRTKARIAALEAAGSAAPRSRGRRALPEPSDPDEPGTRRRGNPVPAQPRNAVEDARFGFRFFGEFAKTVHEACTGVSASLERMENVATTYGNEGAGADGGYLVPPEFRTQIWQKVTGEQSLLSRCAPFTTGRNSLTFPKDETAPWDNSAGVSVDWVGEGAQATASKPKFETETARLKKLVAMINVTEELLDDAPGLDSYLRTWVPIKMNARLNTAIVRGTGSGQPLGILNSSSVITVAKETSQDAASITMPNIDKMWNRLYAELRPNAIWLINQEVEPQLSGMQFIPANEVGAATASIGYPVYLPAGGLANSPFATMKGRPVLPMQPCSALGTIGDIILTDLMQYMALTKGQGIQEDVSMHFYFDQVMQTFRMLFRVTGQPMWNSVISAENGSNTYSWAVVLATRA